MCNYRKPHPSSPSLIAFLISLIPVSLYPAVSAVITIDSRSYTVPFQRSFRLSCTYAHILPGMTSSQLAGTYSGNVKSAGLILYLFRYCSVTFSFTRLQSVSVCSPVRPYSLISSEDSPFSAVSADPAFCLSSLWDTFAVSYTHLTLPTNSLV